MNSNRRKSYKASRLRKIKEIAASERQKLKEMYPQITDEDIEEFTSILQDAMKEASKGAANG